MEQCCFGHHLKDAACSYKFIVSERYRLRFPDAKEVQMQGTCISLNVFLPMHWQNSDLEIYLDVVNMKSGSVTRLMLHFEHIPLVGGFFLI